MFQDFSEATAARAQLPPRPQAEEAAQLLQRYPNLSEIELARLINLYRGLSALDVALMMSDASVAPHLDLFSTENRSKIRVPFRQYAMLAFLGVLAVATVVWAIGMGP
jgi:hypothetical protein